MINSVCVLLCEQLRPICPGCLALFTKMHHCIYVWQYTLSQGSWPELQVLLTIITAYMFLDAQKQTRTFCIVRPTPLHINSWLNFLRMTGMDSTLPHVMFSIIIFLNSASMDCVETTNFTSLSWSCSFNFISAESSEPINKCPLTFFW